MFSRSRRISRSLASKAASSWEGNTSPFSLFPWQCEKETKLYKEGAKKKGDGRGEKLRGQPANHNLCSVDIIQVVRKSKNLIQVTSNTAFKFVCQWFVHICPHLSLCPFVDFKRHLCFKTTTTFLTDEKSDFSWNWNVFFLCGICPLLGRGLCRSLGVIGDSIPSLSLKIQQCFLISTSYGNLSYKATQYWTK